LGFKNINMALGEATHTEPVFHSFHSERHRIAALQASSHEEFDFATTCSRTSSTKKS
jgi:hypothetical protein